MILKIIHQFLRAISNLGLFVHQIDDNLRIRGFIKKIEIWSLEFRQLLYRESFCSRVNTKVSNDFVEVGNKNIIDILSSTITPYLFRRSQIENLIRIQIRYCGYVSTRRCKRVQDPSASPINNDS